MPINKAHQQRLREDRARETMIAFRNKNAEKIYNTPPSYRIKEAIHERIGEDVPQKNQRS